MPAGRSNRVIAWLKAAGEPSRLRLLALCRERELSVSDLAAALDQSEPRVSRHLRILCEAGLLQRSRQGQWVHYRIASNPAAASFTQGLLAQLDRDDPQLARDRERIGARHAHASQSHASGSRLGRALQDFIESSAPQQADAALLVGVEHPELLLAVGRRVRDCTAIAHSARGAQSARVFAGQHGFDCRVLLSPDARAVPALDADNGAQSFDFVVLDHLAVPAADLQRLLVWSSKRLTSRGRIWLFERYEALESSRGKVAEHPLAVLRRLLRQHGLSCEHLSPIEADGEHVLAAVAIPANMAPTAELPTGLTAASTLRSA